MRMHAQTAMIENGFVHLPKGGGLARRLPARADGVSQGEARRPGRLDPANARLVQARRPGTARWLWQMYKEVQARGPQPSLPEPLSVIARRLSILQPL